MADLFGNSSGVALVPELISPDLGLFGSSGFNDIQQSLLLGRSSTASVAFSEGIAAGDMTNHSAILWTRTSSPTTKQGVGTYLIAEVSSDRQFSANVLLFDGTTDPTRDYTIKIDVSNLQNGTQYYYRFETLDGAISPVGTFKTSPDPSQQVAVRFGFSGDADGQWRPYGSLLGLEQQNLDYFIFLGDTI